MYVYFSFIFRTLYFAPRLLLNKDFSFLCDDVTMTNVDVLYWKAANTVTEAADGARQPSDISISVIRIATTAAEPVTTTKPVRKVCNIADL